MMNETYSPTQTEQQENPLPENNDKATLWSRFSNLPKRTKVLLIILSVAVLGLLSTILLSDSSLNPFRQKQNAPAVVSTPKSGEQQEATPPSAGSDPVSSGSPSKNVMTGYLGCSMSRDAVNGYHTNGGQEMWPPIQAYSAGVVKSWVVSEKQPLANNTYWQTFASTLAAQPTTDSIWWNVCISDDELIGQSDDEVIYQAMLNVLAELRRRVGTMPIYISPTPFYENPKLCKKTTPTGPQRTTDLVNRLVGEGDVLRGPVFPTLLTSQLSDSCHPNAEGQKVEGEILKQWF